MSKREKILIAFALTAILAFVYFNYFLTPVQKQTKDIRTALEDNRLKAKEIEVYRDKIDEMNDELEKIDEKSRAEIAKIPAKLDQAGLMMELDRITEGNGRIESVIFEPAEERTYYMAVPVVLEVYCTYRQMHGMIDQLEHSEHINLLREIKVDTIVALPEEAASSAGQGNNLDMMLTLDFLGLGVNEIVPGTFDFMEGGVYGNGELFGVIPAESAE